MPTPIVRLGMEYFGVEMRQKNYVFKATTNILWPEVTSQLRLARSALKIVWLNPHPLPPPRGMAMYGQKLPVHSTDSGEGHKAWLSIKHAESLATARLKTSLSIIGPSYGVF